LRIAPVRPDDIDDWVRMRAVLWPEAPAEVHRAEVEFALLEADRWRAWIVRSVRGAALGFAEASIRTDYVNGCETSPVVFLEGIWVEPEARRRGIASALVQVVEAWGREHDCREFASDALADNLQSHALHRALGFEETERVVYFRRQVPDGD
jgi:aminoglycoside 6'-N-acetyltransferase I